MALEIGNKYGLTRGALGAEAKRLIRQACGFGCVICGIGIYEYEHIDPPFSEAREHDPEKMALLCPTCHHKVTSKMWSKEKVASARANPFCKQIGYSREFFDIGNGEPYLQFCGAKFQGNRIPIMIKQWTVFRIAPGEN